MAREKKEEEGGVEGGWINTFADLMNLLLCFFVLLFSMSTVDADKYEALVTSMTERINIFNAGGSAVGEGAFVSSGTDQLVSISQYFGEFEESGEDTQSDTNQDTTQDGNANTDGSQSPGDKPEDADVGKMEETMAARQKEAAEKLYGEVNAEAQKQNIEDQININIDENNQFVQISLNGALLFDSGDATIKKSMMPLMSKVGDILKRYESHMIKIEGHTDNVPISGRYESNMLLSTARANSVFEYFVHTKKIKPESMETSGRGEYDPIANNKTAKGRAQNRRVEIKIYTDK